MSPTTYMYIKHQNDWNPMACKSYCDVGKLHVCYTCYTCYNIKMNMVKPTKMDIAAKIKSYCS